MNHYINITGVAVEKVLITIISLTVFIMLSSVVTRPMWEFTWFIRWMQTKHQVATNPQIKPTDLSCESTCRLPSFIIIIFTQCGGWCSFYRPTESRRRSWPRRMATYRVGLPTAGTHSSTNYWITD